MLFFEEKNLLLIPAGRISAELFQPLLNLTLCNISIKNNLPYEKNTLVVPGQYEGSRHQDYRSLKEINSVRIILCVLKGTCNALFYNTY